MNDTVPVPRRYQDEVPAVARACRVLDRLCAQAGARTLADLSRDLEIGPSSLLAILTTLRRAGLVSRDAAGRYRPGPGLVALGEAAGREGGAFERFAAAADALVERFGETVLLWVRHEESFVLAAAREGTRPLRYVPIPGLRRPAAETALGLLDGRAAVVQEELAEGVWSVAVALPPGRDGQLAALGVAGPRERLTRSDLPPALLTVGRAETPVAGRAPARPAAAPASAPEPPGAWHEAGPIGPDELDAFLRQGLLATLSYIADDGFPATVPLWYAWDGAAFWLVARPGSEWAEQVCLDPRVSLAVSESTPPLRRVLARGRLAEAADPDGTRYAAVEAQLAARYVGFEAAREQVGAGRGRLLTLVPERLIAWHGLLRYPKPAASPEAPDAAPWRSLG